MAVAGHGDGLPERVLGGMKNPFVIILMDAFVCFRAQTPVLAPAHQAVAVWGASVRVRLTCSTNQVTHVNAAYKQLPSTQNNTNATNARTITISNTSGFTRSISLKIERDSTSVVGRLSSGSM